MRETMGSLPGALGLRTSPVGRRFLKTEPAGALSPIFLATCIRPSGVQLLLGLSPTPNFEVEILYVLIGLPSLTSTIF